jgi:hypothetical protein
MTIYSPAGESETDKPQELFLLKSGFQPGGKEAKCHEYYDFNPHTNCLCPEGKCWIKSQEEGKRRMGLTPQTFDVWLAQENLVEYFKLDQCVTGHLYRIFSRNLRLGIFDGQGGFIGIRTKFGERYLFTEYHWDAPAFPTVKPLEDLGQVPEGMILDTHLGSETRGDIRRVVFTTPRSEGGQGWVYEDTGKPTPQNINVWSIPNTALFKWVEEQEAIHCKNAD